jgi:hypothetical protein
MGCVSGKRIEGRIDMKNIALKGAFPERPACFFASVANPEVVR